jgi:hypothetical protein
MLLRRWQWITLSGTEFSYQEIANILESLLSRKDVRKNRAEAIQGSEGIQVDPQISPITQMIKI